MRPSGLLGSLMLVSRAAQLVLQEDVLQGLDGDVTPSRANVLRLLGRQGRQSVNGIASFLGQTKASASQNVDALVKAGLVTRDPDVHDRRCVWVRLTAKGKAVIRRAEKRQRMVLRSALARFARRDVAALDRRLRDLAFALLQQSRVKPGNCLQCCAYDSAACVGSAQGWRCAFMERLEMLTEPRRGARGSRHPVLS